MRISLDAGNWSHEVFGGCELGDKRRTSRLVALASQLARHVGEAPVRACRGDTAANEGAYRFVRNREVDARAIAEGGFGATVRLASQTGGALLALEDSTSLSYGHEVREELGAIGSQPTSKRRGFMVHTVLLVEERNGRTLGLLEQERWCRDGAAWGQRHARKARAYEDKESFKWQRASERMSMRLGELQSRVISVCDREADIYEYLQYKVSHDERFVVRASWDRGVEGEVGRLFEVLAQAVVLGKHDIEVAQRGGAQARKARKASLEVSAARLMLDSPRRAPGLGGVEVNVVRAVERHPPAGQEAMSWLLLTSEPIATLEQARQVLRYYARRWRVEDFHKAWKSGTKVEERRMQSAGNLERMVVVLAFIAVRLLQLRECMEPGEDTTLPTPSAGAGTCAGVLDDLEWKVLWMTQHRKRPPATPPTLEWACKTMANLGGWLSTPRGRPGWAALWEGWFRLQERVDAVRITEQFLPDRTFR